MANLHNVVSDVEDMFFPDAGLKYKVKYRGNNIWIVYISIPDGVQNAKLELIIHEDPDDPEFTEVAGSLLRYGSLDRHMVGVIIDEIIGRL